MTTYLVIKVLIRFVHMHVSFIWLGSNQNASHSLVVMDSLTRKYMFKVKAKKKQRVNLIQKYKSQCISKKILLTQK